MKVPVSGIGIGPVSKKDVMKAAVMLEHKVEYATILAFDVKVTKDAQQMAEKSGVKIFTADIIYHLHDQMSAYMEEIRAERRAAASGIAVFPCLLKVLPEHIYARSKPIVCGVTLLRGQVGGVMCSCDVNMCSLHSSHD
jgi:translation initiation factor 5B